MANHYERRKKIRHEPSDANVDEGGSSHAHVVSGRNLRPRAQKRARVDDDIEEENLSESSGDDDDEDETFRVEHRHGKCPAQQNNDDEEDAGDIGGNEEEEEGDDSEEEEDHPIP
jgi:hypothetical protein